MKSSLYAIYVTLAVVIAVVLLLLTGGEDSPEGEPANGLDRHIILVTDSFAVEPCEGMRVVGSYRRTDATGYQSRLAFSAPSECVAAFREAALARGFTENEAGDLVLDDPAPRSEALTFFDASGQPRAAFEWEKTGQ